MHACMHACISIFRKLLSFIVIQATTRIPQNNHPSTIIIIHHPNKRKEAAIISSETLHALSRILPFRVVLKQSTSFLHTCTCSLVVLAADDVDHNKALTANTRVFFIIMIVVVVVVFIMVYDGFLVLWWSSTCLLDFLLLFFGRVLLVAWVNHMHAAHNAKIWPCARFVQSSVFCGDSPE